jgi:hypothetical protein
MLNDGGARPGDDLVVGVLVGLALAVFLAIAWFVLLPLLLLLGEVLIVAAAGAVALVAARLMRVRLVVEARDADGHRIELRARGLRDAERKAADLAERLQLGAALPEGTAGGPEDAPVDLT